MHKEAGDLHQLDDITVPDKRNATCQQCPWLYLFRKDIQEEKDLCGVDRKNCSYPLACLAMSGAEWLMLFENSLGVVCLVLDHSWHCFKSHISLSP